MKAALVVLVLAAAFVAGCGSSGGGTTPSEKPGAFITRILREEINGQWGKQWSELHPGHQELISRAAYIACSRGMSTDIGIGNEVFRVIDVRDEPIDVKGVPEKTSKLVTISFHRRGNANTLTYRLHAVNDDGRWVWILGARFISEVEHGRCLDGSPLPSR